MYKAVLSFGSNPGDIEMGCGGCEALLADQGYVITHVYLAYAGEDTASFEKEARDSAAILGVDDVRFLTLRESPDTCSRTAALDAARLIREMRPEIIFTFSGCSPLAEHHELSCLVKAATLAALEAPSEQIPGEPWKVETIFGFEIKPPLAVFQQAVNITASMERKLAAIRRYDFLASKKRDEAMQGLARYRGAITGAGPYAEVFEILHGRHDPYRSWDDTRGK